MKLPLEVVDADVDPDVAVNATACRADLRYWYSGFIFSTLTPIHFASASIVSFYMTEALFVIDTDCVVSKQSRKFNWK